LFASCATAKAFRFRCAFIAAYVCVWEERESERESELLTRAIAFRNGRTS